MRASSGAILALAAVCAAGAVAGFIAGRSTPVASPEKRTNSASIVVPAPHVPGKVRDPDTSAELPEALAALKVRGMDRRLMLDIERGVRALSLKQLPGFLAEIEGVDDLAAREAMLGMAVRRWADLDPDGALDQLIALEDSAGWPDTNLLLSQYPSVFDRLAERDPAHAFARWADCAERHPGALAGTWLYRVIDRWRETDPEAAFEVAIGTGRAEAVRALCNGLDDPRCRSALHEKLMTALSGETRAEAVGMFVRGWAGEVEDRAQITAWIDAQEYSPEEKAAAERALARVHLRRTAAETAEWLVSRATPETLPGHLEIIVDIWAHDAPNACGEWLAQREFGPQTDAALGEFATTVMRDDLVSAFAWGEQVTDAEERFRVLSKITSHAARTDPGAAREAILRANLSEEQAEQLLHMLE